MNTQYLEHYALNIIPWTLLYLKHYDLNTIHWTLHTYTMHETGKSTSYILHPLNILNRKYLVAWGGFSVFLSPVVLLSLGWSVPASSDVLPHQPGTKRHTEIQHLRIETRKKRPICVQRWDQRKNDRKPRWVSSGWNCERKWFEILGEF